MCKKVFVKVDSSGTDIYHVYYDGNKMCYEVDKNFTNYFYISNEDKYIIDVNKCKKVAVNKYDKSIYNEFINSGVYTLYEHDVIISNRYVLDKYSDIMINEKAPLKVAVIDIENMVTGEITMDGRYVITCISLYDFSDKKCYTFVYDNKLLSKYVNDKDNNIVYFSDEREMLKAFSYFISMKKYNVITGWNVWYDINNIINRMYNILGKRVNDNVICKEVDMLSPFNVVKRISNDLKYNKQYNIFGVSVVDYIDIYKKFQMTTLKSYSLQNVAMHELGEGKVDYSDVGNLNDLYEKDLKKYIMYNRRDTELLYLLDDKLKYLDLLQELANIGIVNLELALFNTIVIDNLVLRSLHKVGKVARGYYDGESITYEGGYVYDVKVGIHDKYIMVFDVNSLYPTIMRMLYMSPENINMSGEVKTGSELCFNRKVGLITSILDWLYKKRKDYKKLMNDNFGTDLESVYNVKQMAYKLLLNSIYGYFGYSKCRFYSRDLKYNIANSVTATGREIIKKVGEIVKGLGYEIVAGDTDSVMITRDDFKGKSEAEMIEIGHSLMGKLNEEMKNFIKERYCTDRYEIFNMEFEKLAKRGIHYGIRRYVHYIVWKGGHKVDNISYAGVDVKRADSNEYVVNMLDDIYRKFLKEGYNKDEIYRLILKYVNEFDNLNVYDYGIPFVLRGDVEDYVANAPHIRGIKNYMDYFYVEGMKKFDIPKGRYYFVKPTYLNNYIDVISIPEGENSLFFNNCIKNCEIDKMKLFDRFINKKLRKLVCMLNGILDEKVMEETNIMDILVSLF